MTLIIIAGGIDLSAGTAIALCATVLAHRLEAGADPLLALSCSILCGVLVGAVNGTLVSRLRVVPFIITLGTMTVSLGVAKILAREMTIRPPLDTIPDWLTNLLSTSQSLFGYLPAGVWIAMILSVSLALLLRWTVFGRHLYAIGSNEAAARLCGINVGLVKILLYSLAGLFIGIAGIYQFSKITSGSPTSGIGMELRIIAAVVIGGASLQGGRGTVLGTICGAFIMSIISNGCTHLNVSNPLQDIILGLIVITAVSVDQWRQVRRN
jgi:ribose/xylose/arabinose/galactoside ABC-type transport system permease subunit